MNVAMRPDVNSQEPHVCIVRQKVMSVHDDDMIIFQKKEYRVSPTEHTSEDLTL